MASKLHSRAKTSKLPKSNNMAGQLAYNVWASAEALPVVGAGLRDVRYVFLNQLRDAVEAFTELIGTMLFALLGAVAGAHPHRTPQEQEARLLNRKHFWPALGNGLTLAVMVYMTAKTSGGKLNPAVSIGLLVSGSMTPLRCLMEVSMQLLGGIIGAGFSKLLTQGTYASVVSGVALPAGNLTTDAPYTYSKVYITAPGCFTGGLQVNPTQVFFWELITTFVLVSVVFATAVDDAAAGHFVSVAPLAIGLSLFASAQASGPYTGGCLNPARYLGPALVFANVPSCGPKTWPLFPSYIFGEVIGGALAGALFKLRMTLQQLYKDHLAIMAERAEEERSEEEGLVANAAPAPMPASAPAAVAAAPVAAAAGSKAGTSSGWVAYKDGAGKEYYHNTATGATSWTKPEGF